MHYHGGEHGHEHGNGNEYKRARKYTNFKIFFYRIFTYCKIG